MRSLRRKSQGRSAGERWAFFLAAPAALVLLGACESLILSREPEAARIQIDSNDVSEVTLITSKWFVRVADPDCPACDPDIELVESDTTVALLPFTGTYPFNFRLQFYAEAFPSAQVPVTLSMTAHVDDREWYNNSRTLQPEDEDGMPETLRFVYQYTQARVP